MQILEAQRSNFKKYYHTSIARGTEKTFIRLTEEIGEIARALRNRDYEGLAEEIADGLAWLFTLASLTGIDAEAAYMRKYGNDFCFRCLKSMCICPEERNDETTGKNT